MQRAARLLPNYTLPPKEQWSAALAGQVNEALGAVQPGTAAWDYAMKVLADDPRDQGSPDGFVSLLQALYQHRVLKHDGEAVALDIMRRCRGNALRALLPRDVVLAHKPGGGPGSNNDVGLLEVPGGPVLAVAVLMRNSRLSGGGERARDCDGVARSVRHAHEAPELMGGSMRKATAVAGVVVLVAGVAAALQAQGRGGRPVAGASKVERVTVHGKALEGNLEGDSPDRDVTVYLPPSYQTDQARRFPVVYLLHGYGGRENTFTERLASLQESADRLANEPGLQRADRRHAQRLHAAQGQHVFQLGDDRRLGTVHRRGSGGLHGQPLPDAGRPQEPRPRRPLDGRLRRAAHRDEASGRVHEPLQHERLLPHGQPRAAGRRDGGVGGDHDARTGRGAARAPGFGPSTNLASAAAWSPNPNNPPLFLDLPVKDGKVRPDIVAKWVANAPLEMVEQHAAALMRYYAVAIDIGTKDDLIGSNRQVHEALTRLRVPHYYEEYDGDHTNRVRERVERNLLPFFAKNLVSPVNPTSPTSPPE